MIGKGLTVKELYDLIEPLLNEYGDLEVRVSYDSGFATTDLRHVKPEIILQPMRKYSYVKLEGS